VGGGGGGGGGVIKRTLFCVGGPFSGPSVFLG
jgi:hypothetical protein